MAEEFNAKYQYALGNTIVPRDNSLEIVRKLREKVRQYVVSNGTIIAQNKKVASVSSWSTDGWDIPVGRTGCGEAEH